jgi:hypothetical protein
MCIHVAFEGKTKTFPNSRHVVPMSENEKARQEAGKDGRRHNMALGTLDTV